MVEYSERDPSKNPFAASTTAIEYANKLTGRDPKARGTFASRGQSTAQFERWLPNRNHEYFDTMARMYIDVSNEEQRDRIRNSISSAADIVDVLVGWGNYVAFFFGQEAPIFSYTGTVRNTYQDNWLVNLYKVFQHLARGTKLASRGVSLQLTYDSFTFFGAMTSLNWRLISGQETYAAFAFNFLVKKSVITTYNKNVPYSLAREDLKHAKELQYMEEFLAGDKEFQSDIDADTTAQVEDPYGAEEFSGKEGVFKYNTVPTNDPDFVELTKLVEGEDPYDFSDPYENVLSGYLDSE
jgi:hypothetical protein